MVLQCFCFMRLEIRLAIKLKFNSSTQQVNSANMTAYASFCTYAMNRDRLCDNQVLCFKSLCHPWFFIHANHGQIEHKTKYIRLHNFSVQ